MDATQEFIAGEEGDQQEGDASEEDGDSTTDKAVDVTESFLGVSSAHRAWSRKLGTDPYSSNEVLRAAIREVAWAESLGSFGMGFAGIPAIPGADIIGEVNDVYIKVAKIKGDEIPWHNHAEEDELFYIISGSLLFEVEGEEAFTMEAGDLYIVKRGDNHRVSSEEECSILLVENKSTAHLGDTESEITRSLEEQLDGYV